MILMSFDENKQYSDLVADICAREYPQYDNLVIFVHGFLIGTVKKWCSSSSFLSGGSHDEDVMQEIQIKIIKNCERKFFKPVDGKTEKTCEEFKAWCYVLAKRCFITYYNRQKKYREDEKDFLEKADKEKGETIIEPSPSEGHENRENDRKRIRESFVAVLDLKSSPHIILTWLSVSLFIVGCDISRIESTHLLAEKFSEITLFEMFNIVVNLSSKLKWLELDDEYFDRQREKLEVIHKETGIKTGDMKYSDFYMAKGPEKSISDWVNKVNKQIKKQ